MNAVDTNILVYARDRDPRDVRKRDLAAQLVNSLDDGVLLWQVSCEFLAASRKLANFGFTSDDAWRDLQTLQKSWTVALPSWTVLAASREVVREAGTSFWDSLLVAACAEAGVNTLFSEDFGDLDMLHGVRIVNPFVDSRG